MLFVKKQSLIDAINKQDKTKLEILKLDIETNKHIRVNNDLLLTYMMSNK